MQKKLIIVFQILISLGLLIWLFLREDLRTQLGQVIAQADPAWLVAGLLVAGFGNFLGIFRWGIILKMLDVIITKRNVFRMGLVGLFFNSFLIGAIGGDAVKAIWLAARGCKKSSALMSVGMDRMSGIPALIFCSMLFMTQRLDWLRQSAVVAGLTHLIFSYLIVIGVLFLLSLLLALKGVTERIPERGPGRLKMIELATAYRQFIVHWRETMLTTGVSVFMFVSYYATFYCAARAFGVQVPVLDFFAFMPTVDIVSALPVSAGGFGVREQLFTVLLGDLCQVEAAKAVLISITGALLTMAWGLGGLIVLPSYRQATQNTVPPAVS